MEDLYLIRYGEIALKGENRPFFEKTLVRRIKNALRGFDGVKIERTHGRMFCFVKGSKKEVLDALSKVFGIVAISPAKGTELSMEAIGSAALEAIKDVDFKGKTFKVETRRPNKSFPVKSPEISRRVGAHILRNLDGKLKVDVHNPEIQVDVEVRDRAYVYCNETEGPGGLPVGCNGRAVLMMSGGIDSPVAGYMIAKRGVEIEPVYFHSFPFTSDRAKEKVIDLCKILAQYTGKMHLHVVNFTEVLKELGEKGKDEYITILMRRMMVRVSQEIAKKIRAKALITGESLGQVASQTIEALNCTSEVADMSIFRPLIGFDKREIIDIAKQIGTYETSIKPYADCCTIFVPEHPKTKPAIPKVQKVEEVFDIDKLVNTALKDIETIEIE